MLAILPTILELIIIILICNNATTALGEFLLQIQFYILIPFIVLTTIGIKYSSKNVKISLKQKIFQMIFGIIGTIFQLIVLFIFVLIAGTSYGSGDAVLGLLVSIIISIVLVISIKFKNKGCFKNK